MIGLILLIFRSHGLLHVGIIFSALAIHEISHFLCCNLLGYRAAEFKPTPFGGSLVVDPLFVMNPRVEATVAAAGPIANLIMAGGVIYLRLLGIHNGYLDYWLDLNLVITLVNLIPAFPLDGGRILHAWLNQRFGLNVAAIYSRRLALTIALLSLTLGLVRWVSDGGGIGVSLTIIGIFIFMNYFSLKIPNFDLAWRLSRSKKKFLLQKGFLCLKPIIVNRDTPLRVPLRRYGTNEYLLFYVPVEDETTDNHQKNEYPFQLNRFRVISEEQAWEYLIAGGYHTTFGEICKSV